ncbi:Probable 5'-methylthioadenosine phosphorylase [Mycobacteroides abscessus]|nr:Probable 5'-methylthioadenosine phosphorylase [Mycobacteroides abscessus]
MWALGEGENFRRHHPVHHRELVAFPESARTPWPCSTPASRSVTNAIAAAAIALVTDLDAGVEHGQGVRAVDVFAEFERNIGGFKELVRSAVTATESVDTCGHCRAHDGVTLPIELP